MRARKQELRLVLLLLSCQLVIGCAFPPSRPPRCYSIVTAFIGDFDSAEAGARAAVRRLSEEIHRCGEAKEYNISWKFTIAGAPERAWRALKHIRKDKTSGVAGYEYRPASGTGETYWVDDSAVHQVANEGGTLSDFAKYQKKKNLNVTIQPDSPGPKPGLSVFSYRTLRGSAGSFRLLKANI